MKKFFVLMLFCVVAGFTASAQPQKYYFIHPVGQPDNLLSTWFILDRENKTFQPESDSETIQTVKNYKKEGNKETFEVWDGQNYMNDVELVTADGQTTVVLIYKGESGTYRDQPVVLGTEAERDAAYERVYGKEESGGGDAGALPTKEDAAENAKGKVSGGLKNAFNKTKDLFKKKDK